MAMKKNVKPKNDTIDAAGKVVVSATKSTIKGASAAADSAEKFLVAAVKAQADPVKFLKQIMGSKKAASTGKSMLGAAGKAVKAVGDSSKLLGPGMKFNTGRKPTKTNKPSSQTKKK